MPTQPGTSTCKLKGMVFGAVVFGSGVVVASQHANCNDLTIDGVPWEDASGYDCAVTPHPLYLGPACSVLCKQEMRRRELPWPLFIFFFCSFLVHLCGTGLRLLVVPDGGHRRACGRLVRAVWRWGLW